MNPPIRFLRTLALCAALSLPSPLRAAGETNLVESPVAKPVIETNAPELLRSYVQLQEQLHAAQLAIERNRLEAESAATRNAELITAKLTALEQSLTNARSRELEQLQGANRLMLIIGGSCAAVGFLAMLLTAWLQWRAVNRLTEFSMLSQASFTMGRTTLIAGGDVGGHPMTEQGNARLSGALERLEKRIIELEHTTLAPAEQHPVHNTTETASTTARVAPGADRLRVLVAKGQSLLNLDQTEGAIACFDDILALEPQHTETLVKKGEALERLRRVDEAILCYDLAIAADASMTIAYLHKGGLFNRMERYEEALKCYELALHTQEKKQAA